MNKKALLYLLNEFAPAISFFVAAQLFSFYTATSILMIFTVVALLVGWHFDRRLPIMPIISGFFVLISGFITLVYQKPDALIFADSLYYFLMGLTIALGLAFEVNILKRIFSRVFAISEIGWKILTIRWVVIFLISGSLNELVRIFSTPEAWVNFKFAKVIALSLIGLYQFTLTKKYRLPEESTDWGLRR